LVVNARIGYFPTTQVAWNQLTGRRCLIKPIGPRHGDATQRS